MIRIIKELSVEVTKPNVFQAIVAKQYDMNTRFLKVTLTDCGNVITIPYSNDIKVVINAERIDGQSKGFDGVVNEDGTVTVPLHSWMLELEGFVKCDISVIDTTADDNKKLTTTSFDLLVEKAAYGGDDVTSDPQYDVLVELIERVENLEGGIVDQTYDPESPNAQSGKAVAEAVAQAVTPTVEEFVDMDNIFCKNNHEYVGQGEISELIIYLDGEGCDSEYICSITFTTGYSEWGIYVGIAHGDPDKYEEPIQFIGDVPDFGQGETWELNIKNGVVVAGKVVEVDQ